jgi:hypothetical protein
MIPSIVPYASLEEANLYVNDVKLDSETWLLASDAKKLKCLKLGTLAIDNLNFRGTKTDSAQVNEFPRNTATVVPDPIKMACIELALCFCDGIDPDLEEEMLGDITEAYATIRNTSDPNVRKDHIRAGIPSTVAWKYLLPYLNDPYAVAIRRV